MTNVAIIGTQWGDEGKGKVVDLLSDRAELIVRFQGGNNAGHTLVVGDQTFALHTVPSGVLRPGKISVIASGVVVDPEDLLLEIRALNERGARISPATLKISDKAHMILPYHRLLDSAREKDSAGQLLGTTGRGIGPTYEDKAARIGLRLGDLRSEEVLRARLTLALREKNCLFQNLYGVPTLKVEDLLKRAQPWRSELVPYLTDTADLIQKAQAAGRHILFEGAQGVQLDLDHGTYPYVTSSNPTTGAVAVGTGLAPRELENVLGLVKAYTSRVGEGPFPTELGDETGEFIRQRGQEFGTTTGRPRRCGWLDAVVVRSAVRLCGVERLAVTKLDVLSGLKELKIACHYELDGQLLDQVPADFRDLARCRPVYETVPGFSEDIQRARKLADLPAAAQTYLRLVEKLVGRPTALVSVGPERSETIVSHEYF
ncbi:MAG: adenylosuccinate synthase [Deltaproteobacteria bacterium]|jgi:adenylosuccinate synthase|nr:adenylosuccinate synthase [Deltaproteobacteria bacterium]